MSKIWMPTKRVTIAALLLVAVLLGILAAVLLVWEIRHSRLQAWWLSRQTKGLDYPLEPGLADSLLFPDSGPLDLRRGYARIPQFTHRLLSMGYEAQLQRRMPQRVREWVHEGISPPYEETLQTGLLLQSRYGDTLYHSPFPAKAFSHFDSIPQVVVLSLLFIEDRQLLENRSPYLNPAVNWTRFAGALWEYGKRKLGLAADVFGGSTLATQLEKYKHSQEGRTLRPEDKLNQMMSASLRAYGNGPITWDARKRIVLDYVNTVPLSAFPGYGEVNGLGEGLLVWFSSHLDSLQSLRRYDGPPLWPETQSHLQDRSASWNSPIPADSLEAMGRAYRQVIYLFLAHRRPSAYLLTEREALGAQADRYLRLMASERWIAPQLAQAALAAKTDFRQRGTLATRRNYADIKTAGAVRSRLLGLLDVPSLYDLDRLDLAVQTSLAQDAQQDVTLLLQRLRDSATVDSLNLSGFRMLEKGDPSRVVYSFSLFERVGKRNLLRVQTDNFDQPLDINEGVKLDLGSTAKFRTLVSYLEAVADLYLELGRLEQSELKAVKAGKDDRLTSWALEYLQQSPDSSLEAMLEAALLRSFSASPAQSFFTGGGAHRFGNFDSKSDSRSYTVREAFRHSANLPFVRIMRELVRHYMARSPGGRALNEAAGTDSVRLEYLQRFANSEGTFFLTRFFRKYQHMHPDTALHILAQAAGGRPRKLAATHLSVFPEATLDSLVHYTQMHTAKNDSAAAKQAAVNLHKQFQARNFTWGDKGYLAGVHPLELWLVNYMRRHPEDEWMHIKPAAQEVIIGVYDWLFKTRRRANQDLRIQSILEMEAFTEIHRRWKRLGYPFDALVPSLATSLGASADKPAALAELMGIIQAGGMRYPTKRFLELRFARQTPYQTHFALGDSSGVRVLPEAVARVAKSCLIDVVENGTGKRAFRAFPKPDSGHIPLGGKTGTGDHRFKVFGPGGKLMESRAVSRSATFMFLLGDRYFGTLTAYVAGEEADAFRFTSSLPVQILKILSPVLLPLFTETEELAPF